MAQGIFGKLFGDRGYISQDLFEKLYEQQLQLITRYKKNMKQKLVKLIDKILLLEPRQKAGGRRQKAQLQGDSDPPAIEDRQIKDYDGGAYSHK